MPARALSRFFRIREVVILLVGTVFDCVATSCEELDLACLSTFLTTVAAGFFFCFNRRVVLS